MSVRWISRVTQVFAARHLRRIRLLLTNLHKSDCELIHGDSVGYPPFWIYIFMNSRRTRARDCGPEWDRSVVACCKATALTFLDDHLNRQLEFAPPNHSCISSIAHSSFNFELLPRFSLSKFLILIPLLTWPIIFPFTLAEIGDISWITTQAPPLLNIVCRCLFLPPQFAAFESPPPIFPN